MIQMFLVTFYVNKKGFFFLYSLLQKCKTLHFPTRTVEVPTTDTIPYLMYRTIKNNLADLKDNVDETLQKEFSRISEKGRIHLKKLWGRFQQ